MQPANVFNTIIAQIKERWSDNGVEIIENSPLASDGLSEAFVGRGEDA